jgi:hypothetical protein
MRQAVSITTYPVKRDCVQLDTNELREKQPSGSACIQGPLLC